MSEYIQHRLFIRAASFEAASKIIARYAGSDKAFTFTKVLPNPNGDENDETWNILNWGTYWDCSHSLILRPVGSPLFEIRFRTYGHIPDGIGRRLKEDLGNALVGWVVHYSCDTVIPWVYDDLQAAGFDVDDLEAVVWHTVSLETFEAACDD